MKTATTIMTAIITTLILAQAASAGATETAPAASIDMKVNINEASQAELEALPYIGPSKAEAILKYRANRPFKKVEQLMRVKGIGRKTFNKLKGYLTVTGPTSIPKKK